MTTYDEIKDFEPTLEELQEVEAWSLSGYDPEWWEYDEFGRPI